MAETNTTAPEVPISNQERIRVLEAGLKSTDQEILDTDQEILDTDKEIMKKDKEIAELKLKIEQASAIQSPEPATATAKPAEKGDNEEGSVEKFRKRDPDAYEKITAHEKWKEMDEQSREFLARKLLERFASQDALAEQFPAIYKKLESADGWKRLHPITQGYIAEGFIEALNVPDSAWVADIFERKYKDIVLDIDATPEQLKQPDKIRMSTYNKLFGDAADLMKTFGKDVRLDSRGNIVIPVFFADDTDSGDTVVPPSLNELIPEEYAPEWSVGRLDKLKSEYPSAYKKLAGGMHWSELNQEAKDMVAEVFSLYLKKNPDRLRAFEGDYQLSFDITDKGRGALQEHKPVLLVYLIRVPERPDIVSVVLGAPEEAIKGGYTLSSRKKYLGNAVTELRTLRQKMGKGQGRQGKEHGPKVKFFKTEHGSLYTRLADGRYRRSKYDGTEKAPEDITLFIKDDSVFSSGDHFYVVQAGADGKDHYLSTLSDVTDPASLFVISVEGDLDRDDPNGNKVVGRVPASLEPQKDLQVIEFIFFDDEGASGYHPGDRVTEIEFEAQQPSAASQTPEPTNPAVPEPGAVAEPSEKGDNEELDSVKALAEQFPKIFKKLESSDGWKNLHQKTQEYIAAGFRNALNVPDSAWVADIFENKYKEIILDIKATPSELTQPDKVVVGRYAKKSDRSTFLGEAVRTDARGNIVIPIFFTGNEDSDDLLVPKPSFTKLIPEKATAEWSAGRLGELQNRKEYRGVYEKLLSSEHWDELNPATKDMLAEAFMLFLDQYPERVSQVEGGYQFSFEFTDEGRKAMQQNKPVLLSHLIDVSTHPGVVSVVLAAGDELFPVGGYIYRNRKEYLKRAVWTLGARW